MSTWDASAQPSRDFDEQDEEAWEATRAQTGMATQVMRDRDDVQALALRQVGRQVGPSQWELFTVIDAAEALQQQFDVVQPEYVTLHDIGTLSSRRMLAGLAVAAGRPVHQLHIRRQGLGMPLARLEFVELPTDAGLPPLRLYTTEIDADTQQRKRLARLLLAHSRLAVVIVGDLPPHALATALLPLHDAIKEGPWRNRELLMLPLAGASALASQAAHLAIGSQVQVRTTPLVTRPAEAWSYLRGTWNKLRGQLSDQAIHVPEVHDPIAPPAVAVATPTTERSNDASTLLQSTATPPPRAPPIADATDACGAGGDTGCGADRPRTRHLCSQVRRAQGHDQLLRV